MMYDNMCCIVSVSYPLIFFCLPFFPTPWGCWSSPRSTSTSSFNKLLLQKEELEQKHVHLLQVVESEKTAKWQYTQQCEELASEIRKLRAEVSILWCSCVCTRGFGGVGWCLVFASAPASVFRFIHACVKRESTRVGNWFCNVPFKKVAVIGDFWVVGPFSGNSVWCKLKLFK